MSLTPDALVPQPTSGVTTRTSVRDITQRSPSHIKGWAKYKPPGGRGESHDHQSKNTTKKSGTVDCVKCICPGHFAED